ncbi:MAG TPA: PhzF family phenazine biosynthesis protein [Rhodocyclaceae bacterium]|nr:PhzF family phenazine biosynthesis protein [Rhodocyclaceae bacterium]
MQIILPVASAFMKTNKPRTLPYYIADVFTEHAFGGNQLAIFPHADELSDAFMQKVAREFNFSETAFVSKTENTLDHWRVRIFAPNQELQFAGHPTIGTAHVLAAIGALSLQEGANFLTFVEGIGPVPIKIEVRGGKPVFCQFTAAMQPEFHSPLSLGMLSGTVAVRAQDVLGGKYGPDAISCGVPFNLIPLATRACLSNAQLDIVSHGMFISNTWAKSLCLFAFDDDVTNRIHMRVFSPNFGFVEDPATGAAAAALAAYLAKREEASTGTFCWEILQGYDMDRPSQIAIEADKADGEISAVRVGGTAVLIGSGMLSL